MSGYFSEQIKRGRMLVVISANYETGPYQVTLYKDGNPSSRRPPICKTLIGARRAAERVMNEYEKTVKG